MKTDDSALNELYQEILMDHASDPRNHEKIEQFSYTEEGYNPLCGDRVKVGIRTDPNGMKLEALKYEASSCSICLASASLMSEVCQLESIQETESKIERFRSWMTGTGDLWEKSGDLNCLQGVKKYPSRIKCALLPWVTLKGALLKVGGSK